MHVQLSISGENTACEELVRDMSQVDVRRFIIQGAPYPPSYKSFAGQPAEHSRFSIKAKPEADDAVSSLRETLKSHMAKFRTFCEAGGRIRFVVRSYGNVLEKCVLDTGLVDQLQKASIPIEIFHYPGPGPSEKNSLGYD